MTISATSGWFQARLAREAEEHRWRQEMYAALAKRDGGFRCYYCNRELLPKGRKSKRRATLDHRIPKSQGGTDDIGNLVLACYQCNQHKGPLTVQQYAEKLANRRAYADPSRHQPVNSASRGTP
jgi:5-methylcytosine-specific restriction endonuclease McrA